MSINIEICEDLPPSNVNKIDPENDDDECGVPDNERHDSKYSLYVDNDRSVPVRNASEDEFDFDSAFSSESNHVLTDESAVEQQDEAVLLRGSEERERLRSLEDEHEVLSSNLIALTSHFAQVQLRLRQIVEAPQTERDGLLKNLEEFAFLGIPEIQQNPVKQNIPEIVANLDRSPESVENLREKQHELIEQLKTQLMDLERYAYESGAGILPQSILLEKQKVIIEEIKKKINLNLNELDLPQLTSEDLRQQVDSALDELVNPLKMKEQLVTQLKTQIQDLERFIGFLQTNEKAEIKKRFLEQQQRVMEATPASGKDDGGGRDSVTGRQTVSKPEASNGVSGRPSTYQPTARRDTFNNKAFGLMDKAGTLLQMFALSQFNCSSERTRERSYASKSMTRTRENCWGDVRARLEYDVHEVASLAMILQSETKQTAHESDCNEVDEDDPVRPSRRNRKHYDLTLLVRKRLSKTIQMLMQHGLRGITESTGNSLVPFISGCFSSTGGSGSNSTYVQPNMDGRPDGPFYHSNARRKSAGATTTAPTKQTNSFESDASAGGTNLFSQDDDVDDEYEWEDHSGSSSTSMHAWELLLIYYNVKNGDRYNSTPARKLSESFNLDIVDGRPLSNKQSLLSAIGSIVALHSPYKRSYDSQFKAFICAGLNAQKLTQWLYLIYQGKEMISSYYSTWSYVANTGFRDALKTLDTLTQYRFDLPEDLSIRQFKNIKDVFM
ncbi:RUN domain-containing protein 1 [Anopheles bellator]|uniref:RUN domain-containing protein 1 n=1 Tax=Anopheles bellator TaxID=139047 RepID=UPI00264973DC|nr:RUN domain-containing protein 1 [Anopheles bellator]